MIRKYFISMLLFLICSKAISGTVDLSFSTSYSSNDELRVGERVKFSLHAINNGPDVTGTDSNGDFPLIFTTSGIELEEDGLDIVFFLDESVYQSCQLGAVLGSPLPGNLPTLSYGYTHPAIAPGESAICYGEFQVFESTSVVLTARSLGDTDPNFSDNSLTVSFGVRPQPVPLLSMWTLSFVAVMLLIIGLVRIRE